MVKHEIKKITHYEYWSWWVYYAPLVPLFLWYSIKARSLTYFTAVNPSMKHGGLFDYSKFKIQNQIPVAYRPQHIFLPKTESYKPQSKINFPLVAKPDKGERGKDVQIIEDETKLQKFIDYIDDDIILQEFIDSMFEYGLFYARLPHEDKGKILSITGKRFLTYKGDGKTSLREFIESDSRAYFNKSYLYMKYHDEQDMILPSGQEMVLELIGNHNRGTYFYEATHLITFALENTLNEIAKGIEGFYFGRFDVKATSIEALQQGKFIILEVNGANSEATHIFDKKLNILEAYKEVVRHLNVQYMVAKGNLQNGVKPDPTGTFIADYYRFLMDSND